MLTVGFLKWYGRDSCFRDEYWRILFCVSSYYYYYYHYYQCQGIKPKALVLPEKLQIPEEACVCFPLILCQYFENFMPCTLIIRVSSPYSSLTLPTASLSPQICVCQRPSNIICVVHMSLDAEPSVDSGIPTQGPTFQENVFTLLKLPTVSRALVRGRTSCWNLFGPSLCRSYVCCFNCRKFIHVTVVLCSENIISL